MHLRELFGKDLHHARYIGIFFEFFDLRGRLFFRCIVADEERGEDFGKEFAFCPKTEIGPDAFECNVDILIDEDDFGVGLSFCFSNYSSWQRYTGDCWFELLGLGRTASDA